MTSCLWGGQLADREERSDQCDHLCFGLESLIQPLRSRCRDKASLNGGRAKSIVDGGNKKHGGCV